MSASASHVSVRNCFDKLPKDIMRELIRRVTLEDLVILSFARGSGGGAADSAGLDVVFAKDVIREFLEIRGLEEVSKQRPILEDFKGQPHSFVAFWDALTDVLSEAEPMDQGGQRDFRRKIADFLSDIMRRWLTACVSQTASTHDLDFTMRRMSYEFADFCGTAFDVGGPVVLRGITILVNTTIHGLTSVRWNPPVSLKMLKTLVDYNRNIGTYHAALDREDAGALTDGLSKYSSRRCHRGKRIAHHEFCEVVSLVHSMVLSKPGFAPPGLSYEFFGYVRNLANSSPYDKELLDGLKFVTSVLFPDTRGISTQYVKDAAPVEKCIEEGKDIARRRPALTTYVRNQEITKDRRQSERDDKKRKRE